MNSDINQIIGAVGNRYGRQRLSPPSQLRDAASTWRGLDLDEILDVLDGHFEKWGHLYNSGSGDRYFGLFEQELRKALDRKRGFGEDGPAQPKPLPKNRGIKRVPNAVGTLDAIDYGDDVGLEDDDASAD